MEQRFSCPSLQLSIVETENLGADERPARTLVVAPFSQKHPRGQDMAAHPVGWTCATRIDWPLGEAHDEAFDAQLEPIVGLAGNHRRVRRNVLARAPDQPLIGERGQRLVIEERSDRPNSLQNAHASTLATHSAR
jgi:hypothetical protein